MKRPHSNIVTSPNPEQHKVKKMKTSAPVSQGIVQMTAEESKADADGGEWTKVDKRKVRKMKRTDAKLDAKAPRFMYSPNEIIKRREAIGVGDIRDFALHLIADAPPVGWVRVENRQAIQKVVVILIPGITLTALSLPPLPTSATSNPNLPISLPLPQPTASTTPGTPGHDPSDRTEEAAAHYGGVPFIAKTFSHACPTKAPGEPTKMHSVMGAFFQGPVSGEEKKKRLLQRIATERAVAKSPSQHVLKLEQMIENEYPIPSYMADVFTKPQGWVETPQVAETSLGGTSTAKVYAIDCEMCLTEDGKELTRVCLIDFASGNVEYDQLVKPPKPITDYLTRFSGITAESLAPVTTTLPEVQSHLLKFLSVEPTPILLGHSLESDLRALKLCHPKCIDTAIIYHHPRGRPLKPGLAWLTKKWCGREIQARGEGGHDPEEDARACLELLQKKLENGPGYGEFKTDFESIFERMSRSNGHAGMDSVRSAVVDHGNPATWHGAKANTPVGCTSDEDVYQGLLEAIPSHQFVFGRFTDLADVLGWVTPKTEPGADAKSIPPTLDLRTVLSDLDGRLTNLYNALPSRTAFVIFTGHSDPRKMSTLNAKKSTFENALRTARSSNEMSTETWSAQEGRELEEAVERAKRGLVFLSVKI